MFEAGMVVGALVATAVACLVLWGLLRLAFRLGRIRAVWVVAVPLGALILYGAAMLGWSLISPTPVEVDGVAIPASAFRTQSLLNFATLCALFAVLVTTTLRLRRRNAEP
ncbi:hypothetical protein [Jannaschia aquimarina]|uniref:Uncharacterized protein n=1 Tax=Jannaschia aquimarina TaxID=935700 RepID=A0A0D1EDH9_9RHOB|nr:hypothetical protein [Jannaschia aquimarina]KIT15754.1 hypothetical protein jaqu_24950 [Jannaschia aquimarina]SNT31978.1 hypothetical protein SAMN05421775_11136 [Jannaschia aquimarina]